MLNFTVVATESIWLCPCPYTYGPSWTHLLMCFFFSLIINALVNEEEFTCCDQTCHQTVSGVFSEQKPAPWSQPAFPFPMNQRRRAASSASDSLSVDQLKITNIRNQQNLASVLWLCGELNVLLLPKVPFIVYKKPTVIVVFIFKVFTDFILLFKLFQSFASVICLWSSL